MKPLSQNDHWPDIVDRSAVLRAHSMILRARCEELRHRGRFTQRRLTRLLLRSMDLATLVLFQTPQTKPKRPRSSLRLLA
ncbi:MAG TPA: hypothetical protein VFH40_07835 [Gemmatimonadales bacterium]|nr:hypothetical protein [Gemmatimonadales bacterium]